MKKENPYDSYQLHEELYLNEEILRSLYTKCNDVVFRKFLINRSIHALLIYIDALSNIEEIDENVLAPLMKESTDAEITLKELIEQRLAISNVRVINTISECISSISIGDPILLIDGVKSGISLALCKWEKRAISEPTAEGGVRGPREGFTESAVVNISLIRRIIKSPLLKMESLVIGDFTKTKVTISYIEGIVDHTLVEEVKNRLSRIQIDGILESGYIEELIQDYAFSPFPQLISTERPDVVCGNLLEGRVAILVDGTPFALIAPITFFSLLQSSEDYYQHFISSTAIRWLRYFFLGISLLLPALYVAVITFHQEMLPTSLLISMASAREAVPFPAIIEVLIMEVTFEALREAGVRLPKQVGAAVSIVGALVIGQAAVQAGLVSAPMVIVVAITGIASFMMPRYPAGIAIRLLRFPIIILAGTLGLLGVMLGIITIVIHMCSLRSFGVPYLSSVAALKTNELKDVLIRGPWWAMDSRPHLTGEYNQYRQTKGMKPGPEKGGE
ncbi:spore germination protein [Brevibacillus sp. SYSU BS000544]|uniref:spore germination protein n=1 Tax=Brevibacillus sp. SYSU BS000544 TaxID=3416443 RepID=UPI003CE45910